MPKTIQQSVIGARPGSAFRAFNGALSGKLLYTRPGRMIVQTWRSTNFERADLDSILVLTSQPRGRSGGIQLVHANVADRDVRGVTGGWKKYYWTPWRAYLKKRR